MSAALQYRFFRYHWIEKFMHYRINRDYLRISFPYTLFCSHAQKLQGIKKCVTMFFTEISMVSTCHTGSLLTSCLVDWCLIAFHAIADCLHRNGVVPSRQERFKYQCACLLQKQQVVISIERLHLMVTHLVIQQHIYISISRTELHDIKLPKTLPLFCSLCGKCK